MPGVAQGTSQRLVFHAVRFDGKIYDCGSKIGFLAANVAYALARDDLGPALKVELQQVVGNAGIA